EVRTWTLAKGRALEASYVTMMGSQAVLETAKGKKQKVPFEQLSPEDLEYIELANPPSFSISFSKQTDRQVLEQSPFNNREPPKIMDYVFSAKLKQTSTSEYNHELNVEFFAMGEEIDGDNYILLDHQKSSFTPTKENKKTHMFSGEKVTLVEFDLTERLRGQKYGGYLVVATDARGKIIEHKTSHDWLFENIGNLRQIPVGKHFDKTCTRVGPPRPRATY
ncbi:MAG: hypothetical protein K9M45_11110, partial [Kiritimatiellales bacterium]|nr:hypothetical protein [Kiritimatiellales bacterium]